MISKRTSVIDIIAKVFFSAKKNKYKVFWYEYHNPDNWGDTYEEEARNEAENVELPNEYVEDSFDIVKVMKEEK